MNKTNTTWISVDVCDNDPVDVKAGGPEYLGFDFYVNPSQSEKITKLIETTMKSLNIPIMNIRVLGEKTIDDKNLWTEDRIIEEIIHESSYLKQEVTRNYSKTYIKK